MIIVEIFERYKGENNKSHKLTFINSRMQQKTLIADHTIYIKNDK